MELTVEVLRDAEFREGWRGYNPADVDEFIDRISVGVQELQDRIHALSIRAERAESRLGGENDETVKRTLVLAQRAADLVVSEAKSVAERIVQDARREAERTIADANTTAALREEQSELDVQRRAAEQRSAAENEYNVLISSHRESSAEAEQESRLAIARSNELHIQALALRDRFRAALTDQLVRLDRLVDAVDPHSGGNTTTTLSNLQAQDPSFQTTGGAEPAAPFGGDPELAVPLDFSLDPIPGDLPEFPTYVPGTGRHSAGSMEGFE